MKTYFQLCAVLCLTFALFVVASAAPGPLLQETTVRDFYPNDVQAIWQLEEENGSQNICPKIIQHTTWKTVDGIYILPHNTIEQNGLRCNSKGDEKRLEVYESANYDADLNPIDSTSPVLPPALVQSLKGNGRVINIYNALIKASEPFMIGFESKVRVCNDVSTIFKADTPLFFARPFDMEISIRNLDTKLLIGYKYMLIVPTNQATTCVYSVNIDASPDMGDPSDSPEPIPSDDPMPGTSPSPLLSSTPPPIATSSPGASTGDDMMSYSPDFSPDMTASVIPTSSVEVQPQEDPDMSPSESAAAEDDDVCFPSDARVTLSNGRTVRMDQLEVGQYVSVGHSKYSRVYGFSHNDARVVAQFVILTTESGHTLRATAGHFVYVDGLPTTISRAVVGSRLTLQNGHSSTVSKKEVKLLTGLYNPQTVDGNIVVDGVLATTFTAAVRPLFANAALLPLRAMQRLVGGDCVSPFTGSTARRLLSWLPKGVSA